MYITNAEDSVSVTTGHTEQVERMGAIVKAIFFVCACVALCCGGDKPRLNIVLIGVDTLRPDHMGCYGYERNTTPNVDRLASEGVLFENAVSQSPWTLPSFATVFTSLYPTQHGAVDSRSPMRTSFPTLATLLRHSGYATGAIINAPYLRRKYEIDRGFDFYDMTPRTGRAADGTTRDALKWIDLNMNQPFFIFIHFFDPHIPYAPPAPYDTIFDPDYRGRIGNSYDPQGLARFRQHNFEEMKSLTPADWNHIESLYDGEIAFTDEAIEDLLRGLDDRGLRRNTLIVFLGDHGEEFFEHGGFEHGHTLFDELIRAPLILSLPGVLPQGVRLRRQVRLLDVAPTILDLLNIKPETRFEGVSLNPALEDGGSVFTPTGSLLPPEIAYSEATLYGGEKKSLTAYPLKVIYDVLSGEKICFNLAEDPGEQHNIVDTPNHSLAVLEETLFRILFTISDTWFVELAGGDREHTFDIHITSEVVRGAGRFSLHKVFDHEGRMFNTHSLDKAEIRPSTISVQGLKVKEPLTIAFKLRRTDATIGFDFKIDGMPATRRTFIGRSLLRPVTMPFTEQDSQEDSTDKGKPARKPEPPYVLIWLSKTEYGGDKTIELDEETKTDLRALGYIE